VDNLFIFLLVAITSLFAYYATHRQKHGTMRNAMRAFFEWTGTFSLFFVANLASGTLILFFIRTFTPTFISLYALQNVLLLILSAAQAFVFHHVWKRGSNH